MRKDPTAIEEWSPENVLQCIIRQKDILNSAAIMVRPGGKLVYSTCTFEYDEDEGQVESFLSSHSDFSLVSMHRIWPHQEQGEGHFSAVLKKRNDGNASPSNIPADILMNSFVKRLNASRQHILRAGVPKGEFFKDKKGIQIYEPSHAEIMNSIFENVPAGVLLNDPLMAVLYLKGNVLRLDPSVSAKGPEGFCGIYFDGYPLGVGKRSGDTVKNHLPKGLRRLS